MSKEMTRFGKWASLCLLFIFTCVLIPLTAEAVTIAQAQEAGKRLSAGLNHSLAIKIDDTVIAWGDNTYGQLNIPEGLSNVKVISAGYYHNLALKADGSVVAWGRDNYGQSTVPVEAQSGVIAIAAGGYHSLALKEDGTVVAWGNDENGQCTVSAEAQSGVIAIAAGGTHSLALKEDGTVVAWGNNDRKQCNVPTGLTDVIAISAGNAHSLALKADGTVEAWGANTMWQCEVPVDIGYVVAISAGYDFSATLNSNGLTKTWGNIDEILPVTSVAFAAGGSHVLMSYYGSGTIYGYGNNDFGQCTAPDGFSLLGYLADLTVSEGELIPAFAPYEKRYNVYVDNSITSIDITATLEHVNQMFRESYVSSGIPRTYSLNVGENEFSFCPCLRTVGQDFRNVYSVYVHRATSDVDLKELNTTNIAPLSPIFNVNVTTYTVNVDKDVKSIDITATAVDPEATIFIGEDTFGIGTQMASIPLEYGENSVDIIVEKDGKTKTYTLQIKKAGFLENLFVSEGEFTSNFDPENFGYTVSVNSNVNSLEITPTLKDSTHELWIDGVKCIKKTIDFLEEDFQTIKIDLKIPDTEIVRTYTVNANRVTKDDFVGSGTFEDPYLIYNLHTLQEIAYDSTLLDKHFQLACDLDATNTVNWNAGAGFLPIGDSMNKFTGYFDGAGHTITGLYINRAERDNIGLFGCTEGGEIKNLGLVDCTITGSNNVGALVGHNQNTYLENCFSTGNVYGTSSVGGLVGFGSGSYAGNYYFNNCYSWVSVTGDSEVGGLIGELGNGWLNNCYASGSVFGMENKGGLVGSLVTAYCRHTNCFWDTEESGQVGSALGIGKTTAEMQDKETYGEWDFDSIWDLDSGINEDYPYLRIFKDTFSPIIDDSLLLWLDGRHGSNDTSERTIWRDISGNANHGTLTRFDFNENSGWIGESLFFDGVNDYVNCGTKMNNKLMNAVTVEALVKIKSYDIQNWVESFLAWGNQASRTVIWLGYRVLSHYTFEVGNEVVRRIYIFP
ncbi:MAG: cadherin-like beta sandwich domain-containing protein [Peptococcia bacterium]